MYFWDLNCSWWLLLSCPFLPDIQREEEKVKRSIKDAAKKGQKDVCVILAKEMIQSKRAVTKLYASKAQMNSVLLSMKNQLGEWVRERSLDRCLPLSRLINTSVCFPAVVRVAGALQKSTEVMKVMQNLVKIPEIQATMMELSKEMMKVRQTII